MDTCRYRKISVAELWISYTIEHDLSTHNESFQRETPYCLSCILMHAAFKKVPKLPNLGHGCLNPFQLATVAPNFKPQELYTVHNKQPEDLNPCTLNQEDLGAIT